MIPANELRIGNRVFCKKSNGEIYETEVYNMGRNDDPHNERIDGVNGAATHDGIIEWEECWPIPLTDERLLNFGFKQERARLLLTCTAQNCYFASSPFVGLVDGTTSICLYQGEGRAIGRLINFVHQLQNLYFALTGEEIKINEYAKG